MRTLRPFVSAASSSLPRIEGLFVLGGKNGTTYGRFAARALGETQ